jgi:hypothetical protein
MSDEQLEAVLMGRSAGSASQQFNRSMQGRRSGSSSPNMSGATTADANPARNLSYAQADG